MISVEATTCRLSRLIVVSPHYMRRNVRFGSLADIPCPRRYVCFTPESGHCNQGTECRLRANNGLRYRGKWHHQSSRQQAARRAREWLGQLPSRSLGVIEAGDREVTGFERI